MDMVTRMRAFIEVVEAEGFSAAARRHGKSKAILSKYVRELEDEIGAVLLNRTTRQFSMTEAGHTYYTSASEILREIDNLGDLIRANNTQLKGRMRVSVSRSFVDSDLGQSFIDFGKEHPAMSLEVIAEDRFVDLIEEGFDVAIRSTRLDDSDMIARKLSDFHLFVCASPEFVEKYPMTHPSGLSQAPFIVDTNSRTHSNLRFTNPENGSSFTIPVSGPITVNSPRASMRGALAGVGAALLPDFVAAQEIQKGNLVTLFDDYLPTDLGIYAVYPHRRYLPAKIRAFIEYLSDWFRKHNDLRNGKFKIPS